LVFGYCWDFGVIKRENMSFFSSKKEEEKATPSQKGVITTGGKVDGLFLILILSF
jgi:hypothetical protein